MTTPAASPSTAAPERPRPVASRSSEGRRERQFPHDIIGEHRLPAHVVGDERLDVSAQQIFGGGPSEPLDASYASFPRRSLRRLPRRAFPCGSVMLVGEYLHHGRVGMEASTAPQA